MLPNAAQSDLGSAAVFRCCRWKTNTLRLGPRGPVDALRRFGPWRMLAVLLELLPSNAAAIEKPAERLA